MTMASVLGVLLCLSSRRLAMTLFLGDARFLTDQLGKPLDVLRLKIDEVPAVVPFGFQQHREAIPSGIHAVADVKLLELVAHDLPSLLDGTMALNLHDSQDTQ